MKSLTKSSVAGSSPLARGLPRAELDQYLKERIIPARAGFTGSRKRNYPVWQDHPRSRGVYVFFMRIRIRCIGSSPLARGLPDYRIACVRV